MQNLQQLFDFAPQILQGVSKAQAYANASVFAQTLLEWNTAHNLSGAKNISQVESNLIDSLLPLSFVADFGNCLDVGSGAGFPAVAMALARPNADFHLCEPRAKRAAFLAFIAQKLELKNLHIHKSRIESLDFASPTNAINATKSAHPLAQSTKSAHPPKSSQFFELITSRALMETQNLIKATQNFLHPNGSWLFFKGSKSGNFCDLSREIVQICAKDLDFARTNGYNSERIYLYISAKSAKI